MAELLVWPILAADWQTAAVLPRLAEQQPDSGWLNNQTESGWLEILVVVIADNNLPVIQISSHLTAAVSFCQGWHEQQPSGGWLSNQTESGWLEILVVVIADNNLPVIQISSHLTAAVSFCQGWQSSSLTVAG